MKKLFIINSDIYVRHYLRTDALKSIEDEDLYFLATDDVTLREELEAKKNFLGFFQYDPQVFEQNLFLSNVLMLRHQDRSVTFGWRARRQFDHLLQPLSEERLSETRTYQSFYESFKKLLPEKPSRWLSFQLSRVIKFLKMPEYNRPHLYVFALGRPGLAYLYTKLFEQQVQPNQALKAILEELNPDIVLFPSHAIDPLGNDLVRLQKSLRFKTFYLIDNWDNLSSKSVFIYKPDYLGVWGEQTVAHAREIHEIPHQRVFKLGTPRVEDYYETLDRIIKGHGKPPSPHPFKYILYVGCSIPFDEISSLKLLEPVMAAINAQSDVPVKLVYRPHPWRVKRHCPELFNPEEFEHIVLDEQVRDFHLAGNRYNRHEKGIFQPSLNYYSGLLANAEMVTGPLTTMLVEAALLRKRVLAVAYDDGLHITSPHNALRYYRHFEGISEVPGMYFAHQPDEYGALFREVYETYDASIDWEEQSRRIGYYLFHDHRKYHQRLKDALDMIAGRPIGIIEEGHERPLAAVVS